jgi:hypothetical protein
MNILHILTISIVLSLGSIKGLKLDSDLDISDSYDEKINNLEESELHF